MGVIDKYNTNYQKKEFPKAKKNVKILTKSSGCSINTEKIAVSKATLSRLPHYLQHLRTVFKNNNAYISAASIAQSPAFAHLNN